ncbi:MAG: precorrin-4 C(11)-methyltransferase [Roseburia sp.]|nr:precorrin-4 C(11)-methyltransferase [Roseburia sp.]
MVYFVGAGPGAEDLITIRGMRLLEQADVIVYAGSLVNPALLQYAGAGCELHDSAYMTLEEVVAVIEDAENRNLVTVRLHSGDPSIYGAIQEQMEALQERRIPFSICPGVSSMSAAAAALQLEYTQPGISQSILITRQQGLTEVPKGEELCSLAAHHATMVLFLSAGLAQQVKSQLLAGGYDGDTPVAVVYRATWPEEKILRTTLDKLPLEMEREKMVRTALIIVGKVLDGGGRRSRLYDADFSTGYRKGKEK